MPVKEVLMIGNPALREKSKDIHELQGEDMHIILTDLKDTLTYLQEMKRIGRALAAPQIGYFKKVIYYQLEDKSFVMINPVISRRSKEMIRIWDSCYSFDVAFFVNIERHKEVTVEYFSEEGKKIIQDFKDFNSELCQHEIDHLYGILAIDHVDDLKNNIILRSEWEKRFR
jgi:peptide deformylase